MTNVYNKYLQMKDMLNLTDFDVSKKTGIPQTTISSWKQKENIPKVDNLLKLADTFNLKIEYFFSE